MPTDAEVERLNLALGLEPSIPAYSRWSVKPCEEFPLGYSFSSEEVDENPPEFLDDLSPVHTIVPAIWPPADNAWAERALMAAVKLGEQITLVPCVGGWKAFDSTGSEWEGKTQADAARPALLEALKAGAFGGES